MTLEVQPMTLCRCCSQVPSLQELDQPAGQRPFVHRCHSLALLRVRNPMQGTIDQVDGLIAFDRESERLLHWDTQIQSVCQSLNDILDGATARGLQVAG